MAEVALECLVEALDVPGAEQRLGDVGPAEGPAARDRLDLLERNPDAEPLQPQEDLARPLAPAFAVAKDRRLERRVRRVEAVREQVNVHPLFGDRKLHSGYQADAGLFRAG